VFDEAQQVGPLSNTAVMAGYLKAQHRWVVTGTPIGAGEARALGPIATSLWIGCRCCHQSCSTRASGIGILMLLLG